MLEWIEKIKSVWPTFFVNGMVQYANDTFIAPMMGRMFGYPGAYVANGMSVAAQIQAANTSYFQGSGFHFF